MTSFAVDVRDFIWRGLEADSGAARATAGS